MFAFIFVGTKITREKYGDGEISFGKAFRVGLYITLIASTIYVIVWLIDYHFFIPDFAEKYSAHILETLKASGASTNEDPVTGGVQTFLVKYRGDKLGRKKMKAFQSSARTGFMQLELLPETVLFISQAVIVFEENLVLTEN